MVKVVKLSRCLTACSAVLFGAYVLSSSVPAMAADEAKPAEPAAATTPPPAATPPADESPGDAAARRAAEAAKAIADRKITEVTNKPLAEVVAANPVGTMRNPYTDNATAIEEGKKLYFSYSCNGCHGGGGGGGMCPPLTNDIFVYGSDDDVLFRLIALGTADLQKTYSMKRKGSEGVVGPMPGYTEIIKNDDELWKIIAFIRTVYKGSRRNW